MSQINNILNIMYDETSRRKNCSINIAVSQILLTAQSFLACTLSSPLSRSVIQTQGGNRPAADEWDVSIHN